MMPTDEQLGEWTVKYRQLAQGCAAQCATNCGTPHALAEQRAEEAVSNAVEALVRTNVADRDYTQGEQHYRSLLLKAAVRGMIDLHRLDVREHRDGTDGAVDQIMDSVCPTPDELVSSEELARRVRAAIDQLSDGEQELVRLRFWSQMTFDEMGDKVGVVPATVYARFRKALTKLRRILRPAE